MLCVALLCFTAGPPMPEPLPPGAIARLGVGGPLAQTIYGPICFSPDGRRVAIPSNSGLDLWDTHTRERLPGWNIKRHYGFSFPVFSNDGKRMVVHSNGVGLYDAETGNEIWKVGASRGQVVVSQDWTGDIAYNSDTVRIRDINSGKELRTFSVKNAEQCLLAGSSDPLRKELILLTRSEEMIALDVRTGKPRWIQPRIGVGSDGQRALAYDPRGKWIATVSSGRLVRLWSPEGKAGRVLAMDQGIPMHLSFDPLGRLAVLFHDRVAVYEADSGRILHSQPLFGTFSFVALSRNGEIWVSGYSKRLRCYRIGEPLPDLRGDSGWIKDITARADGGWVGLGLGNEIIAWDPSGKYLCHLKKPKPYRRNQSSVLSLLPGGSGWLQKSSRGAFYAEFRAAEAQPVILSPSHDPSRSPAEQVVSTPDGRYRIGRSNTGVLQCTDARTGQCCWIRAISPGRQVVFLGGGLKLSPSGESLAIAIYRQKMFTTETIIFILNVRTGKTIYQSNLDHHVVSLSLCGDSSVLVSLQSLEGALSLLLWDLSTGKREPVPLKQSTPLQELELSPDGHRVALAQSNVDRTIVEIYESRFQSNPIRFEIPKFGLTKMVWSPDGRTLATGGNQGLIYLWDATGGAKPSTNADADWQRLREPAGHDAAWRLALTPGVEALLARKLRPTPSLDARLWATLLDDLDSEDFAARQAAQERLDALGTTAIAAARRTLVTETRLEIRRRLERFLRGQPLTPEGLRQHRAVFVLEQRKATALLYRLAEGDPDADLTREAKAALARSRAAAGSPAGSTPRPPWANAD